MSKPKVAFYWCASCGGCEEAVVDLDEAVLKVVEAVDIVFWPCAMDFKREDVEKMADGAVTVAFINGAIRTSEQEEMAHLLRKKSQVVIAFGSCSHLGGIPGLACFYDRKAVLDRAYKEAPGLVNPEGTFPQEHSKVNGHELELPAFYDTVKALDDVIPVDYYLPGCPPTPNIISDALAAILAGKLPERGTVLAPDIALCEECPLADSKPERVLLKEFKRVHLHEIEPNTCLLAQGFLCMGPATRAGCGGRCIRAAMPCTGCFGPMSRVKDFGAKALSTIASLVDATDEADVQRVFDGIPDPGGTFYRYSLPSSLLKKGQ
ncbi:MAG: oxidoreductase [Elusimicrobiota bacterium]